MKKINKQSNFSINFTEILYKIMESIKMNMNVYAILLLIIWKKQKMNLFYIFMKKKQI